MFPHQVAEGLLERDLLMLLKYAERHMLPTRRLQMQMAMAVQYTHAAPGRPLSDYDIDRRPVAAPEDNADEIGSMFAAVTGGNVIKLKGWKRKAN